MKDYLCYLPALLIGLAGSQALVAAPVVYINPGDNIQAVVDANPQGTTFVLRQGLYRMQSVQPKPGDVFKGELVNKQRATILNGSRLLTSFQKSGNNYYASGQTQRGQRIGTCWSPFPRCSYPEDVFFDDKPLVAVGSMGRLRPGTFYFDYGSHRIYLADNPSGHKVEANVTRSAFAGPATGVVIQDLVVEKYAAPAQVGAIGDNNGSNAWTIQNCEVRLNHGSGILTADNVQILNNYVHDNGQLGIGGVGNNVLIKGNEVARNNVILSSQWAYAGFDAGWEAGGVKLSLTNGLKVTNNNVHHNGGPGLWTDGNCMGTLYDSNIVIANETGIKHEISGNAIISNNDVEKNGSMLWGDSWYWYGQIELSTSKDVEIYGNTVVVDSANNGNGIMLIQQARTEDYGQGVFHTINNYVHNNIVTVLGTRQHGTTGAAQDDTTPNIFAPSSNNRFDYDTYRVYDITRTCYWTWLQTAMNWAQFQQAGEDVHGSATNIGAGPRK